MVGLVLREREVDGRVGVIRRPACELGIDLAHRGAVEDGRRDPLRRARVRVRAVARREAEMRLEDLADVHAARHAERVQDHLDGRAVGEERHVLLGHDLRDDALVAVAAGELVALRDLALLGDVDAHELEHAGGQVVARVAAEDLDVDDLAALAVGHLQRGVADLARLLLEDRADQLLLGRQLGLALGRDLADEQVAGADLGTDADDAAIVEVLQGLLGAVRDVARDLLVAELRRARVDLVGVDVHRREHVVLHEALGEDDRVLEVVALPGHERDEQVLAERELALVGRGAVGEDLALGDLLALEHDRLLVDQRALVRAHELHELVAVLGVVGGADDDVVGVDPDHGAGALRDLDVAGVDGGAVLETRADDRRLRDQQRHRLAHHVRAHQRAVRVVVLEERDQRGRDGDDLLRGDVHVVDRARRDLVELAVARAHQHRVEQLAALRVDLLARLRDDEALLLRGVEVVHLVGRLAVRDDAVRGLDEAEFRDARVRRQRADQADVRTLGRLDRAHAPVVRLVDVAHLDRRALAGQAAGAERRQAAAVREAAQRVRLVHELRELRGTEELLERRDDRPDVDDRLRRDRVDVLGRHPLADDALHAVEADAERLLNELADRAQAPVAEVLVLVELAPDLLRARDVHRVLGEVLRLLVDAELDRQRHEPAHELDQVAVREHADVGVDVELEARVELVAADARQVVALGVEEERAQERLRVLERRRLARPLLLEDLDEGRLARLGEVLERQVDEDVRLAGLGVGEERADPVVGRDVDRVAGGVADRLAGRGFLVVERAQERRHVQLALAVDADEDEALLVDLELEPGAAGRHQVRGEDLLRRVLRLHDVGARRPHELRHDDALGAVDDERARVRHQRDVAHEDPLLADLARALVDEADRHEERRLVGEVLLAALLEGGRGGLEDVVAELDRERAGVVLDRRDVGDRLPDPLIHELLERLALDLDQVGDRYDAREMRILLQV